MVSSQATKGSLIAPTALQRLFARCCCRAGVLAGLPGLPSFCAALCLFAVWEQRLPCVGTSFASFHPQEIGGAHALQCV